VQRIQQENQNLKSFSSYHNNFPNQPYINSTQQKYFMGTDDFIRTHLPFSFDSFSNDQLKDLKKQAREREAHSKTITNTCPVCNTAYSGKGSVMRHMTFAHYKLLHDYEKVYGLFFEHLVDFKLNQTDNSNHMLTV
jgi:hypothetical protein